MKLREARVLFSYHLALLVLEAKKRGYEICYNEVKRDERIALLNAKNGKGISKSLHLLGLAGDMNLYKNGVYQENTEDHRELGEWWEQQHPLLRWGGRFNDGNHYSLEWEGVK